MRENRFLQALNYLVLLVTVVLNGVMLYAWQFDSRRSFWLYHKKEYDIYMNVLGIVHNVYVGGRNNKNTPPLHRLCFALFISFVLSNASGLTSSLRTKQAWLQ